MYDVTQLYQMDTTPGFNYFFLKNHQILCDEALTCIFSFIFNEQDPHCPANDLKAVGKLLLINKHCYRLLHGKRYSSFIFNSDNLLRGLHSIGTVARFLTKGVDPRDNHSKAFRVACSKRHVETVKFFLDEEDTIRFLLNKETIEILLNQVSVQRFLEEKGLNLLENGHMIDMTRLTSQSPIVKCLLNVVNARRLLEEECINCLLSPAAIENLLDSSRVDPSDEFDEAIKYASQEGFSEIVELLRVDPVIDPSTDRNYSLKIATVNNHFDVVKCLLEDDRVDMLDDIRGVFYSEVGALSGYHSAVKLACIHQRLEILKLFLKNHRIEGDRGQLEELKKWAITNNYTACLSVFDEALKLKRVRLE